MSIGFTPKHNEEIHLTDLTAEQFLTIAIETTEEIKWQLNFISNSGLICYTNNGIFSWNAEIKILIHDQTVTVTSESTGNEMIDFGRNKKMVQLFLEKFEVIRSNFNAIELAEKVENLKITLASQADEPDILKLPPATTLDQIKGFFSLFIPSKEFLVTPILVDLNILIFIAMVIAGADIFNPSGEILLTWGGNYRPLTLNEEWWRLIANCFLHGGIIHLVMNMFALIYIGVLLEPLIGKTKFLIVYILTGLIASLTSICWHELTISIGASGAIFGLYGVFLALLTTNIIEKSDRKALFVSIGFFVAYNLVYGLKSGIDNAAHIGGLLTGVIIGFAYIPALKRKSEPAIQYIIVAFSSFLILTCAIVVYLNLPNNSITDQAAMNGKPIDESETEKAKKVAAAYRNPEFEKIMIEFHSVKSMALDIFPVDTALVVREKSLSDLKDRGLYYWNRSLEILATTEGMKLPEQIVLKNKAWKSYCEHQTKCYQLMYKAIDEHTKRYDNEIIAAIAKGEEMLDEIRNM